MQPTGLNEKECRAAEIDYRYAYVIRGQGRYHAELQSDFFKLIFEYPSGRILGAQAVGKGNVDRRVDIIATAIHFNATVEDLQNIEFTLRFLDGQRCGSSMPPAAVNVLQRRVQASTGYGRT